MPDGMSFADFAGGGVPAAAAPVAAAVAPAAPAAPAAVSFGDFAKAPAQFGVVAPRYLSKAEGGDGNQMTNLSPDDYARFQAGLGPLPAPQAPVGTTPPPAAPAGVAPKLTGLANNVAAGGNDAVAATLGMPVDLATAGLNAASRGIKSLTGFDPGQISNPIGGSDSLRGALGVVGADPRNVAPADATEQVGRAVGSGAVSALLPWGVARAIPVATGIAGAIGNSFGAGSAGAQAAAGAVGGATGQLAEDAAPDALKPYANMAGNIIGGGLTIGSVAGSKALIDAGTARASDFAKQFTSSGQQQLAGAQIRAASSTPNATIDALGAIKPSPIPGYQPTSFQAIGGSDPGLGQLELAQRQMNPDPYMQRAAQQNAARVGVVEGSAPALASPQAVGTAFRQQLANIDAAHAAVQGAETSRVQQAVGALGNAAAPGADQQATQLQAFGQRLRGAPADAEAGTAATGLAGNNATAQAAEGKLWRGIDPDGTLRVGMHPIAQAAHSIMSEMPSTAAPLEGEAAKIFQTAQIQPDVQPFSEWDGLRKRITDEMRVQKGPGGSPNVHRQLSQLLDSVQAAMQNSVQERVASGGVSDIDGFKRTLTGMYDEHMARSAGGTSGQAAAGVNPGSGAGEALPAGRVGVSGGSARTSGAANVKSDNAAGYQSVPTQSRPASTSLLTFLSRRGGVRDPGGDLAAMDAGKLRVGFLRRSGGQSLDYAREAATEAGYLPEGSTTTDLLNAINHELHGNKVYPTHEQALMDDARARDADNAANDIALEQARDRVNAHAALMDVPLSPAETEHAAGLAASGMHPEDAIHSAVTAGDAHAYNLYAAHEAGPPGMPGAAQPSMLPQRSAPPLEPANVDAPVIARSQAARAATAERYATFKNSPGVGQVLASDSRGYRVGDSAVPSTLFPAGAGAAERARAFIKAGGNVQDATDYLAFDMRRAAENDDGTLNQAKYDKWMKSREETFAALPGTQGKFATAGQAQKALDAASARRVEANDTYTKSAAGQFLGGRDPVATVGRILTGDRSEPQMRQLALLTADDPAAREGLQRATIDYMMKHLQGNSSFAAGMPNQLKSDVFQNFMNKAAPGMQHIFSPKQMQGLHDVAASLQEANRSIASVQMPGNSATAQNMIAVAKHGGGHGGNVLSTVIIAEAAGDLAGEVFGNRIGKMIGGAGLVLNTVRNYGMGHVSNLVAQATLHPELMRTLMLKAPQTAGSEKLLAQTLGRQLKALTVRAPLQQTQPAPPPPIPGAGHIATPRNVPPANAFRGPGMPFSMAPMSGGSR